MLKAEGFNGVDLCNLGNVHESFHIILVISNDRINAKQQYFPKEYKCKVGVHTYLHIICHYLQIYKLTSNYQTVFSTLNDVMTNGSSFYDPDIDNFAIYIPI